AAITYSWCCGCGPVGNALALSTCPQLLAARPASISCLSERHSRSMSFDKLRMRDIVHPAAAAIHRDLDASLSERASEGRAGELAALVGVEDLRLAETRQRLFQRRYAERHIHGVR